MKRSDNSLAVVDVFFNGGTYLYDQRLTVKDLREFWRVNRDGIRWLCCDIGLTRYFWSSEQGWHKWSKYRYHS